MHKTCFHTSNNEILLLEKQTGKNKAKPFQHTHKYLTLNMIIQNVCCFAVDDNNHCALSSGQNKCSVGKMIMDNKFCQQQQTEKSHLIHVQ